MVKRALIRVHGRVQGVFFRHSACEKARELNITGFVRNEEDGAVYIEAEGEEDALEQFIAWCRSGPKLAKVEKTEVSYSDELKHFTDFSMERINFKYS